MHVVYVQAKKLSKYSFVRGAVRFVVKGDAGFGKRTLFIPQVVLYVEGLGFGGSFSGRFGVLLGR